MVVNKCCQTKKDQLINESYPNIIFEKRNKTISITNLFSTPPQFPLCGGLFYTVFQLSSPSQFIQSSEPPPSSSMASMKCLNAMPVSSSISGKASGHGAKICDFLSL